MTENTGLYTFPAPPKTSLGRYRVLSPKAGVRVSPLQLGAMSIGDKWASLGMGSMDKESSFKLLDAFYDYGGNFIDTANNYQEESSEQFIGEWAEKRGIRDQLFIATKYSSPTKLRDDSVGQKIMYVGNSAKTLFLSVEASLKNLRTNYIDLMYIHYWDFNTSVEETMGALHALVMQRKVLYLGISDAPAWIVSKANQYARDHALTPFAVYQGQWNIMDRAFERDIIPMARDEGLALCPWGVLAGGKIRTDEEEERRRQTGENGRTIFGPNWERNEKEKKVCKVLQKVAAEIGAKHITSVAIAYLMHKTPFVFPIVGGRKAEQLLQNIEALDISLSPEQVKELDGCTEFDLGFPHWLITGLGRYHVLSPHAGVRVSPIALGAMSIGDKWSDLGMGSMDKQSSFKLLDAYYDNGGNFIDTANNYQDESSEEFIGEWAEKRGIRDQLFIATKFSTNYKRGDDQTRQKIMYTGNNVKSMHISVAASLKKLRTSYIDLLYVHWWDWDTSIEEIMQGLHTLVLQGKVLYLGISDTPAWVVSKANQYARDHALTPFVIYQGAWNIMERSFERDIIPMARSEGMALAPWNVLAAGKIRTDEEEERRRKTGEKGRTIFSPEWERNENEKKICKGLEKVAKEVGAKSITAVAIAYLMQKTPFVFPLVGGRKVEHLLDNVNALEITLSKNQIKYLESIVPFDVGFPISMIGDGTESGNFIKYTACIDEKPLLQPVAPHQDGQGRVQVN
ncbi:hypothetical protein CVT24_007770 [Panaeolus cyanescens]|uniref:NADP-dependent oxidoreductase domain-containing protein n=1 Tax=Panaeolus cyanescens TaxID=181874 RepID=A0A409YKU4_9AGAR|nr:hypothetical protein CVT24_007770 [Panaeolus cyanescens]